MRRRNRWRDVESLWKGRQCIASPICGKRQYQSYDVRTRHGKKHSTNSTMAEEEGKRKGGESSKKIEEELKLSVKRLGLKRKKLVWWTRRGSSTWLRAVRCYAVRPTHQPLTPCSQYPALLTYMDWLQCSYVSNLAAWVICT